MNTSANSPSLGHFQYEIGARLGRGDLAGATAVAAECRAAWPAHSPGWLLGSVAALLADEKQTALALVQDFLTAHPRDVDCLLQKAECLLALGERPQSLDAAEAAAAGACDKAAVLDAVGQFLVQAAEYGRALEIYHRAIALGPKDPALLAKRAALHRFLGEFERAASDYELVLTLSPQDAEALTGIAELRRQSADRNSVPAMESALALAPPDSRNAAVLHFGLAKSYEDIGDYDASWRHLSAANTIERARNRYNPNIDRAFIDRLIAGFPSLEPVAADTTGARPIFIVGLPRTGTTLVERILGSHSAVHPAGELVAFSEAISTVLDQGARIQPRTWLEHASALCHLDGKMLADEYLARSRARRGDKPRFSDKQPTNFLYCPLILRAFPSAPIVHLTRHPLAACYAIYKTHFEGAYPFAYGLEDLAAFYIGYRRLMAHWHRILPGRILDVAYEGVISRQEETTRRLLDHVGLPFEAACLDFHLNPTAVATASSVQVRQPLYDTSVNQWRYFASQLDPVRERLEAAGIAVD